MPDQLRRPGEETEIEGVRVVVEFPDETQVRELQPTVLVISGPDADGEINLLAAKECYLSRSAAFELAIELLIRLQAPASVAFAQQALNEEKERS